MSLACPLGSCASPKLMSELVNAPIPGIVEMPLQVDGKGQTAVGLSTGGQIVDPTGGVMRVVEARCWSVTGTETGLTLPTSLTVTLNGTLGWLQIQLVACRLAPVATLDMYDPNWLGPPTPGADGFSRSNASNGSCDVSAFTLPPGLQWISVAQFNGGIRRSLATTIGGVLNWIFP